MKRMSQTGDDSIFAVGGGEWEVGGVKSIVPAQGDTNPRDASGRLFHNFVRIVIIWVFAFGSQ